MRAIGAFGLVALLMGCGGGAALPGMPGAPPAAEPIEQSNDVGALERRLAENERTLDSELGPVATDETKAAEQAAPTEEAPAEKKPETEPAAPATAGRPSACEVACKALGSMRRSAERICALTGDTDTHCSSARERVARAATRIEQAGCACKD